MEFKPKELGFLASAIMAAGFMTSPAHAQSSPPPQNTTLVADPFKSMDPSVAVKIFPFPKLKTGPFLEADRRQKPQVEFLLPDKRYYEQRDSYSLDLGNGATAGMKGPFRVRVRIPLP